MLAVVADITQILTAVAAGDPKAAAELLPLVYDELRKLAAARMSDERAGHTLQPTALVHEAYIRLVGGDSHQAWDGRAHFFAAADWRVRRRISRCTRRRPWRCGNVSPAAAASDLLRWAAPGRRRGAAPCNGDGRRLR
jgi:hypothetical protein